MNTVFSRKEAILLASAFVALTALSSALCAYMLGVYPEWYISYPLAFFFGCLPVLVLLVIADTAQRRQAALEAQETFTSYPAGFGVTEVLGDTTEQPIVVYCYRYQNGVTQVRAPNITNVHLVLDILAQAEDAARNGKPVLMQ